MDKEQAIFLSKCIEIWHESITSTFQIKKIEMIGDTLHNFHQWANRKPIVSGFEVTKLDSDSRNYFLYIDWHRNGNYYLVIYSGDKSTTVAEMHRVEEYEGTRYLVWKYTPLKRDGKNDQRKAYFKNAFGTTKVQIPLPTSIYEVETFFEDLFILCKNRIRADRIVEVFDFNRKI